ncbi:hypothetical protein [Streptococcus parasanguinis]|uniref:hypothetical protein n=1 Tax=Streptococcus parasanguinis TaxID=1318 RepID=UPI0020C8F5F7|nr:hypothetical protein [Streptococcus parasanguinis]MCP8990803.1 hypothetical protein [Streptococcus parasanguinis]MCP8992708.1 hypothetical protein [Streptococcus parasanguinis]MCP9003848.1 hypothetical protein [Streptococcus parasanguinis]MCP9009853.1 hypothetical protein [Streptococcus parasanguinis]MCP9034476.1 hypothetical protein [Streptococcus parasanguinis]
MNSQFIELDKDTLKYMLDASGGFDENNEIFKFLLTIFASSVSENTRNELPNLFSKFKRPSLQTKANQIIGQNLDELHFLELDIPKTFTLSNSGIKQLINCVRKEIMMKIRKSLSLYDRSYMIIQMSLLASVLSKITIYLNTDFIQEERDCIDFLIKQFNRINTYTFFDPRVFLGELKTCLELIVNELLTMELLEDSQFQKIPSINFQAMFDLFGLSFSIIQLDNYIDVLPFLKEQERDEIQFTRGEGIVFPSRIFEQFSKYISETRDEIVIIGDKKIDIIMRYLEKVKKVSPSILEKYLSVTDDERAFKLGNNYVSVAERDLLVNDLALNQRISVDTAKLIIENLTLNNQEFYRNKIESLVGEPNKRMFRSPLINFSNFDVVPVFAFLESAKYFSYRILRTDILYKKNGQEWTRLIKENFDERLLPKLKDIALKIDVNARTNYYLNQSKHKEIKNLIKSKKLMEEIDLFFVYNSTLYIYDLKNYGLARNMRQCKSIINTSIYKEFSKLRKLKTEIEANKELFEAEFGRFIHLEIGIVTVNTTHYKYFKNGRVISMPELQINHKLLI